MQSGQKNPYNSTTLSKLWVGNPLRDAVSGVANTMKNTVQALALNFNVSRIVSRQHCIAYPLLLVAIVDTLLVIPWHNSWCGRKEGETGE
jgi:hypothetical protein